MAKNVWPVSTPLVHATQSDVNQRFGLPRALHDEVMRRYGFHGLSYESIVSQFPALSAGLAKARFVVAHRRNGASRCAIQNGCSVATTISFSPLDGLTMGNRCGQLDAAVVQQLGKLAAALRPPHRPFATRFGVMSAPCREPHPDLYMACTI